LPDSSESVLQNGHIRHEPENTSQVVTDVNSLVQLVADVSLDQLDDAIVDLRRLREFLHSEGERIQREISCYLQLNHIATDSIKSIVENIVQWKKAAHSTARALPMVFNFDKPETKDFTETVRLLCGFSKFVIVDITNPRSAPLELQATVPDYMVPFAPILQKGDEENPFAMPS
jgi:hypothetical protein